MQMTDIEPGTGGLSVRAVVVSADGFEDTELLIPYFRLLEEGALVRIAAPTREEIGGENGYSLLPDLTFDEVDPDAYDLLVIPGGFPDGAPATVRDGPRARAIARAFMAADKPVATICHGPWLLAAADVVRGRHLTSYWHDGVPEDVRAAGGGPGGPPRGRRWEPGELTLATRPARVHRGDDASRARASPALSMPVPASGAGESSARRSG